MAPGWRVGEGECVSHRLCAITAPPGHAIEEGKDEQGHK
jgi:hypothetical protein